MKIKKETNELERMKERKKETNNQILKQMTPSIRRLEEERKDNKVNKIGKQMTPF